MKLISFDKVLKILKIEVTIETYTEFLLPCEDY
jgi:hypothetical protein